jgi:hypothetical protein
MSGPAILYPIFALAAWTAFVQILIPVARVRSALRRQIEVDDFRYGESAAVPVNVTIPNRNYMNLLEFPVLFYVICVVVYVTTGASPLMLALAWSYVALRILHSTIHLTYNRVSHRSIVFGVSNAVLVALWALAGINVATHPGA